MAFLTKSNPLSACLPIAKQNGQSSRRVDSVIFGLVSVVSMVTMVAFAGAGYRALKTSNFSSKMGIALNIDVDADLHDRLRQVEYLAETTRAMQSQIADCVKSGDCVESGSVHGGVKINLKLLGSGEVICSGDACENRQQGDWRAKAWAGPDGEMETLLFNPSAQSLTFQKWTPSITGKGVQWKAATKALKKDEESDLLLRQR